MTSGSINLSQIWLQISKYQRQFNLLIVILLALYLLAFAADLVWRLVPAPETNTNQQVQSSSAVNSKQNNSDRVNVSQIKRLNLFGDLTAQPVVAKQEVTDAPETRLNLTLTGVVATNEPSIAAAIIENRGMQSTYGIDDEIDGTNASLAEVFADRVIIQNGPRRETLMLDGLDYTKNGPVNQTRPVATLSYDDPTEVTEQYKRLSQEVADSTRELQKSPADFSTYIAISPQNGPDGGLIGYQISPGKNPSLFKEAGFVAGDIVTEINGLDLTDPQQALEAMAALRESSSLQLTINRGEELLTLYLDFPQGEEEQDI